MAWLKMHVQDLPTLAMVLHFMFVSTTLNVVALVLLVIIIRLEPGEPFPDLASIERVLGLLLASFTAILGYWIGRSRKDEV